MDGKLLTVREAASYLAVSASWLYREVELRKVPHLRLGRAIRFDPQALERWLAAQQAVLRA